MSEAKVVRSIGKLDPNPNPKTHGRWLSVPTVYTLLRRNPKSHGRWLWDLGPPRALGPVGPLMASARWKEAPVQYICGCNGFLAAVIGFLAAVI